MRRRSTVVVTVIDSQRNNNINNGSSRTQESSHRCGRVAKQRMNHAHARHPAEKGGTQSSVLQDDVTRVPTGWG